MPFRASFRAESTIFRSQGTPASYGDGAWSHRPGDPAVPVSHVDDRQRLFSLSLSLSLSVRRQRISTCGSTLACCCPATRIVPKSTWSSSLPRASRPRGGQPFGGRSIPSAGMKPAGGVAPLLSSPHSCGGTPCLGSSRVPLPFRTHAGARGGRRTNRSPLPSAPPLHRVERGLGGEDARHIGPFTPFLRPRRSAARAEEGGWAASTRWPHPPAPSPLAGRGSR